MVEAELGKSAVVPPFVREFRPEPFSLTKSEWAADNREFVQISGGQTGSGNVFTVPEGNKNFYITNASLTSFNASTVSASGGAMRIANASGTTRVGIIFIQLPIAIVGAVAPITSISQAFNMPIKAMGGEIIRITGGASVTSGFAIHGYLE